MAGDDRRSDNAHRTTAAVVYRGRETGLRGDQETLGALRNAADNARRIWKYCGFPFALLWALDRILFRFGFQTHIICFHDRQWVLDAPPLRVPPYEVRWASRDEVLAAADGSPDWLEPKAAMAALDRGERCMGAFLEGRMLACVWNTRRGPICRGLDIQVSPQSVYGHEAKTRQGHRGQGLYAAMVLAGARAAAEAGKQMVGYVSLGNTKAVAGSARMGVMRRGFIICREGATPWAWVSPLCRREGISVARTGMPGGLEAVRAK